METKFCLVDVPEAVTSELVLEGFMPGEHLRQRERQEQRTGHHQLTFLLFLLHQISLSLHPLAFKPVLELPSLQQVLWTTFPAAPSPAICPFSQACPFLTPVHSPTPGWPGLLSPRETALAKVPRDSTLLKSPDT